METGERSEGAGGATPQPTVSIPTNEVYDLLRAKAVADVQRELELWGRKRFWVITTLLSVVGVFGGSIILRTVTHEAVKEELEDAQSLLDNLESLSVRAKLLADSAEYETTRAKEALLAVEDELRAYKTKFDRQTDALGSLGELQVNTVDLMKSNEEELNALRARSEEMLGEMERQLQEVVAYVDSVAEQTETVSARDTYQTKASIEEESKQLEKERYLENREYSVEVFFEKASYDPAMKVVRLLAKDGYRVSRSSLEIQSAIQKVEEKSARAIDAAVSRDERGRASAVDEPTVILCSSDAAEKALEIARMLRVPEERVRKTRTVDPTTGKRTGQCIEIYFGDPPRDRGGRRR